MSSSSQKLNQIKDIDIVCGICMEVLVEPTSLNSCGHTYCVECITKYWFAKQDADFMCPVCKKTTHICSIDDFQGNNIITQLIETLKPKGYKRRKEEYFEQKKMYVLLRKYANSNMFRTLLIEMEKYFDKGEDESSKVSCTMIELIRAMKSKFPQTKNVAVEVKTVLSSILNARMICIHGNQMFKCDPLSVSSYVQENIASMNANDVAALLKPFSGMNYEIESTPSKLKTLIRDYQENNLEKIYNYLLREYDEELNGEQHADELPRLSLRDLPPEVARSLGFQV